MPLANDKRWDVYLRTESGTMALLIAGRLLAEEASAD